MSKTPRQLFTVAFLVIAALLAACASPATPTEAPAAAEPVETAAPAEPTQPAATAEIH